MASMYVMNGALSLYKGASLQLGPNTLESSLGCKEFNTCAV